VRPAVGACGTAVGAGPARPADACPPPMPAARGGPTQCVVINAQRPTLTGGPPRCFDHRCVAETAGRARPLRRHYAEHWHPAPTHAPMAETTVRPTQCVGIYAQRPTLTGGPPRCFDHRCVAETAGWARPLRHHCVKHRHPAPTHAPDYRFAYRHPCPTHAPMAETTVRPTREGGPAANQSPPTHARRVRRANG